MVDINAGYRGIQWLYGLLMGDFSMRASCDRRRIRAAHALMILIESLGQQGHLMLINEAGYSCRRLGLGHIFMFIVFVLLLLELSHGQVLPVTNFEHQAQNQIKS